jgi:hypothetical protein
MATVLTHHTEQMTARKRKLSIFFYLAKLLRPAQHLVSDWFIYDTRAQCKRLPLGHYNFRLATSATWGVE